jgi:ADP-ribose pyrophosphatase
VASTIIRAAGGIVLRDDGHGPQVLVVHRPAYDDWSLPKGKLDPGEDDATAAVREVEEETGVRARVIGDAGSIDYTDRRGRPKVVRYFVMMVMDDPGTREPDDEVDLVAWWPISQARTALTYPRDCELLATMELSP